MMGTSAEMGHLLWERVVAAHQEIGAPFEDLDEADNLHLWTFFDLGFDGVLGIKSTPERDGDTLLVALPSNRSRLGSKRTVQIMQAWTSTGRKLYTAAWERHYLALRINRSMGGRTLGIDSDGFVHFEHSTESLAKAGTYRKERSRLT